MSSISINLATMGDSTQMFINWLDENGVPHEIELQVRMREDNTMELIHKPPGAGDVILLVREKGD